MRARHGTRYLQHFRRWLAFAMCVFASIAHAREDVVVVTSFPASLYEPFRRAFEQKEPGLRLRILNRKTTAAIAMLTTGRFEADLFWASAPDAFEVLREAGRFSPIPAGIEPAEAHIGAFPVDDPNGLYRGFSISGYGMMWHRPSLARARVSPPRAIADLVHPRFAGLVAMSAPSRSGTTHLMVETVLQRYGWERGWEIWLRLAGNLATVTARSFSVSSGVAQGRFAIGLSIDFLGRNETGELEFAYPTENVFLPASIAVLDGAKNAQGARRFAAFVLSEAGQRLLTGAPINRFPIGAGIRPTSGNDLFALARAESPPFRFDARLSGTRYELVNILFDELITERLARLQKFWRNHTELDLRLANQPEMRAEWEKLGLMAARLPDELLDIHRDPAIAELKRVPRGAPLDPIQAVVVARIRQAAEATLANAEAQLEALQRRLMPSEPVTPGPRP